ncbi:MAG: aspartate carbamoyltransferase catalytic subunit [Fusobacterium sp.]|nr:aspartate carbamoyltransferase catalytic subunit [Fusobacterium sp.]
MFNLLSMNDLSDEKIYSLIKRAIDLKNGASPIKREDLFISNLFFENSTRTKKSFEVAERKLRMNLINFEADTSSLKKGETLYDTCKTLEMIGVDILVIRHSENEYYKSLENLKIPLINAGDGSGEHPSQCLLDLMTIYEEFGKFEDLEIIIVGDIKNSRVARSNQKALTRLGAKVCFVAPEIWRDDSLGEFKNFDNVINKVDVCMLLRVQHERHDNPNEKNNFSKEHYHKNYGLTAERYKKLKESSIIMHPAPVNRNVEIADELVEIEKSRIFEQMKNGMFMRQAILEYIIRENKL